MMNLIFSRLCPITLVVVIGCTKAERPLGAVTGRVMQDGKPVENLCLEFHPDAGGRPSLAITDENGKFTAVYLADTPGAKIGRHTIRYELVPPDLGPDIPPEQFTAMGRRRLAKGVALVPTSIEVCRGSNELELELVKLD